MNLCQVFCFLNLGSFVQECYAPRSRKIAIRTGCWRTQQTCYQTWVSVGELSVGMYLQFLSKWLSVIFVNLYSPCLIMMWRSEYVDSWSTNFVGVQSARSVKLTEMFHYATCIMSNRFRANSIAILRGWRRIPGRPDITYVTLLFWFGSREASSPRLLQKKKKQAISTTFAAPKTPIWAGNRSLMLWTALQETRVLRRCRRFTTKFPQTFGPQVFRHPTLFPASHSGKGFVTPIS